MNTLYSLGELNTHLGLVIALLIGFFFGWFLEKAGFGSSRKLTGIFYFRDMSVLKVMFTAVVTSLVGYRYLLAAGWLRQDALYMLDTYWGAQIIGGLLFGIGFVMGGWCPGTAFVGLASAKWDALVFLVGAGIGSIIFNETFDLLLPLYEGGHAGVLFLPDTLGVSWKMFPLVFCLIAVGAFAGSTWLERKFGEDVKVVTSGGRNRAAAIVLLLAASGLLFVPADLTDTAPVRTELEGNLLAEVATALDHIESEDLARELMADAKSFYVVDIRGRDAYEKFHIRGAINVPLAELQYSLDSLPENKTIVFYSNGTTHAAQAWLMMRQWGWSNTLVLTDGLLGFWRSCLTPPSLAGVIMDPLAAQEAGATFRRHRSFFIDEKDSPLPFGGVLSHASNGGILTPAGLEKHLVTTEWLSDHMGDPRVKVLDVRAKSTAYSKAHIVGSLYLNVENLRTTIDGYHSMLVPAEDIAKSLGRLGIESDDIVIVYDDRLRDATLMAVALERVGHKSFAILHGGYPQWVKEGRPVSSDIPTTKAVLYKAKVEDKFTVGVKDVAKALKRGGVTILDVRPSDYFTGEKSDEARPGHIPGALNHPFNADVVKDTAMWIDEQALRAAYEGMGIHQDKPIIVHCRTGHQASQTYFLLKHVLGYKDVRWFDASWMAWAANSELPVEAGE